jgi:hypothetical protein
MNAATLASYFDVNGQPIGLPDGTFAETATVLKRLREAMEDRPSSISITISFEDFVSSFLHHWSEHTSTSPSGRHLGIYKSLLTAHCNSRGKFDDTEKDSGLPPPPKFKPQTLLQLPTVLSPAWLNAAFISNVGSMSSM